jgi:hypothetical protein
MNRTSFTRFGLVVVTLVAAAVLFQTPRVQGQITNGVTSTTEGDSYTGNGGYNFLYNLTATDASVAGQVNLKLTGDFDMNLLQSAGTATVDMYGYLPLSVGDLPVQISNFNLTVNEKRVAGGGGSTIPNKTVGTVDARMYEQLGPIPAAGDPFFIDATPGTAQVATFTGNGYQIAATSTSGAPSSFVLGAKTNYYLKIDDYTNSDNTNWLNVYPSVTLTNEFGGTFGDGFGGDSVSFSWATVPEPSTIALLTLGALGLLARRRFVVC